MTLLTKASRMFPDFSSNLMDFFNEDRDWGNGWTSKVPAANITEHEKSFSLDLAAPGLEKDDFEITIDNQQLTISCEKEHKTEETKDEYTRKEFSYESFSRSFVLPDSVNSDGIEASYKDGVLTVELPKKETAIKMPRKQISVG
jgi:HSP20 family protein